MADIDVVPKRRSSIWLWVILAVILVLALFWMINRGDATATGALSVAPAEVAVQPIATPGSMNT